MNWISIEERPLTQDDGEVLAYRPDWINPDFNPKGTRIGFIGGEGTFISAYWWDYQDTYVNGGEADEGPESTCKPGDLPTYYLIPETEALPK